MSPASPPSRSLVPTSPMPGIPGMPLVGLGLDGAELDVLVGVLPVVEGDIEGDVVVVVVVLGVVVGEVDAGVVGAGVSDEGGLLIKAS